MLIIVNKENDLELNRFGLNFHWKRIKRSFGVEFKNKNIFKKVILKLKRFSLWKVKIFVKVKEY